MQLRKSSSSALYRAAELAASAYVAGKTIDDALAVCHRLAAKGFQSTICAWDAANTPPAEVLARYRTALDRLAAENLDCYLSIKFPSLGFDTGMVRSLLEARRPDIRIHFDSLGVDTAQRTFDAIEALRRDFDNIGCTLPARWKRSERDAERAAELGLAARVVKGQWADDGKPTDESVRRAFRALMHVLARGCSHVAIASHDPKLVRVVLPELAPETGCLELEQLYGLPLGGADLARRLSIPVRLYIPYDHGYLPYAVSQLRKNPRIAWWLLRDSMLSRFPNWNVLSRLTRLG